MARSCWTFPLVIRTDVRPGPEELVLAVDPAQLPSVRLVGVVVDVQGNGRAGITVAPSWVSAAGVHGSPLVTTDEYGGFDVGPYPPGTWSVVVRGGETGQLRLGPVELGPGETHDFGDVVVE
jgi:hypothetical protein